MNLVRPFTFRAYAICRIRLTTLIGPLGIRTAPCGRAALMSCVLMPPRPTYPSCSVDSSIVSVHAASDFAPLGIGVELFFNQFISLALVFFVLGFVTLTGLLKNMYVLRQCERVLPRQDVPCGRRSHEDQRIPQRLPGSSVEGSVVPADAIRVHHLWRA